MANTRGISRPVSTMFAFLNLAGTNARRPLAALSTLFLAVSCLAQNQDQPQPLPPPDSQTNLQASAIPNPVSETIPAGTRFALVLTHPIQSRYLHRGDDIYAQITAPITLGNDVVIPPGALVDGIVDKLQRRSGRGELYLQSMTITFPDGYVVPVSGPAVLETVQGYAVVDPGPGRTVGMFALPAAGAGIGALIGHSVGQPQSEVTSAFPPGCIGGPPFCTTTSMPVFGTKGKDAIIGAGIGGAIGAVMSMTLLFSSHHFFLDVGSPVDMVLHQPLTNRARPGQCRRPTVGTAAGTNSTRRPAPSAAASTPRYRPSAGHARITRHATHGHSWSDWTRRSPRAANHHSRHAPRHALIPAGTELEDRKSALRSSMVLLDGQ